MGSGQFVEALHVGRNSGEIWIEFSQLDTDPDSRKSDWRGGRHSDRPAAGVQARISSARSAPHSGTDTHPDLKTKNPLRVYPPCQPGGVRFLITRTSTAPP